MGFRPFVFRLARELGLSGWVRNCSFGVALELQGEEALLVRFEQRLHDELPPLASIATLTRQELQLQTAESAFEIRPSSDGPCDIRIAPDSALCSDCLRELFDPSDRRYRYPFITCTNCGPRYTIVTGVPYDRPLTTMAAFPLCPSCEAEYRNPADRRFHAQPVACPDCGPRLSLYDGEGALPEQGDAALCRAAAALRQGSIVAVKGLGGYHLAVNASDPAAVERLRQRKQRDEKPFAVMVPDLATARRLALLDPLEERLLTGPEAPIVITRLRPGGAVVPQVAPGSVWIGLLLAYTPLHHLLHAESGLAALVMTSANLSDQPMLVDDDEALSQLRGVADLILGHDRPIQVRCDDSVLRFFRSGPLFYRRSRGYAPRAVTVPYQEDQILAVGGELKNTVCLAVGDQAVISQHIGDLKNEATLDCFRATIKGLQEIMAVTPRLVACDRHPDYLSSRYAEELGLPLVRVQHHHAHLASCMAENGLDGELIGVIFDGTGLGDDGTVWGGEFLVGGYAGVQRAAHLRPVRLPGGDAAARETWRPALAWLYPLLGEQVWSLPDLPQLSTAERRLVVSMLERGISAPYTTSAGRLFDAAAFLIGAAQCNSFDGQAGMALEALAETAGQSFEVSPVELTETGDRVIQLDCAALLQGLAVGRAAGGTAADLALAFHHGLADAVTQTCLRLRERFGHQRVALSGGVFQNRLLNELVYTSLLAQGFTVFTHRLVPPNDGGIALGQAAVAARIAQGE